MLPRLKVHHLNSPVASKSKEISLFLIARDVISSCSGGDIKCIAVKGEKLPLPISSLARRKYTAYSLFSEHRIIILHVSAGPCLKSR